MTERKKLDQEGKMSEEHTNNPTPTHSSKKEGDTNEGITAQMKSHNAVTPGKKKRKNAR